MNLKKPNQMGLSLCGLIFAIALLGSNSGLTIPPLVQQADVKVRSAVTQYRQSHSLNDLAAAVNALDGTIQPRTLNHANFVDARRTLAQSYATVIRAIQDAYDPTYNPNDPRNVVFDCVPPPRVEYMKCNDPNQIADPAQRAQYEKAIEENNRNKERLAYYLQVLRLDEHAMSNLSATLRLLSRLTPSGVGTDSQALYSIFQSAGIKSERLNKIRAMISVDHSDRNL